MQLIKASIKTPYIILNIYSRAPVSTDSLSAVSVIRGLLWPETKLEN
jgi:hypothetical protein